MCARAQIKAEYYVALLSHFTQLIFHSVSLSLLPPVDVSPTTKKEEEETVEESHIDA